MFTGAERCFVWAGHVRVPQGTKNFGDNQELSAYINRLLLIAMERNQKRFQYNPFFRIQHAATLIFTGQHADACAAEYILNDLNSEACNQPMVHAWRAFLKLTEYLEFGGDKSTLQNEANEFAADAARYGKSNSLVLSLIAQIEMKLNDDPERAAYLASRALELRDTDPYALNAASHAATLLGDYWQSYSYAKQALSLIHI